VRWRILQAALTTDYADSTDSERKQKNPGHQPVSVLHFPVFDPFYPRNPQFMKRGPRPARPPTLNYGEPGTAA